MGRSLVGEFISDEFKTSVNTVFSKALNGVETANFEFPLITKDERRVDILLNATPRYDMKGVIVGLVGIGQDITERIAQEQEYTRLIDTANAPIFGVDSKGCINIWYERIVDFDSLTVEGTRRLQRSHSTALTRSLDVIW